MASTITDLSDFFDNVPSIQDPDNFEAYATENLVDQQNLFGTGGEIHDFITETNALALEVETNTTTAENSATVSSAAANFKGNWSDLTGVAEIPYSVYHSLQFWVLNTNLADVTAKEPGVDVEWTQSGNAKSGVNSDITSMTGLDDDGIPVAKVDGAAASGANSDITSMTGLDGSDLPMGGGYLTNAQNIPDMLAGRGPGYWFDGVDDVIAFPANANMAMSSNDYSVITTFNNNSVDQQLLLSLSGTSDQLAIMTPNSSGKMEFYYYSGNYRIRAVSNDDLSVGNKTLAWVCDRDTSNYMYLNGDLLSLATNLKDDGVYSFETPNGISGLGALSNSMDGILYNFLLFNLALTPAEVKAFSSGAPIPYSMIGASQTELTSGTLTIGKKYRIKTWLTADDFTNVGAASNADGVEFIATGTTPTTWSNSSVLVRIGCVLDLNPSGVGFNQWQDNSGNQLTGTVSGALPINLPVNAQETYLNKTVTGNTSFVIPKGYQIKSIVIKETAGNALTGGVDIGTSVNGVDIVSGEAIGASSTVNCTLIGAGTIGGTFSTANDTIYISDGDNDANWNSASLEVMVQMQRLTTI